MIRRIALALVAVCFILGLIGDLQRREAVELTNWEMGNDKNYQ